MFPLCAPQSAAVCIQAGSSLPSRFPCTILSDRLLPFIPVPGSRNLYQDQLKVPFSVITAVIPTLSSLWQQTGTPPTAAVSLGVTFIPDNLVGILVSGSQNCDHSSITGSDMLVQRINQEPRQSGDGAAHPNPVEEVQYDSWPCLPALLLVLNLFHFSLTVLCSSSHGHF